MPERPLPQPKPYRMDLDFLRDAFHLILEDTDDEYDASPPFDAPNLADAIEARYTTASEACYEIAEHVLDAIPYGDDSRDEDTRLTQLRHQLFEAVRDNQSIGMSYVAATAVMFAPGCRNTEYELDVESETDVEKDPYNFLPQLAVQRAEKAGNLELKLAYLKIANSIVGLLKGETEPGGSIDDDGFETSLFRQGSVDRLFEVLKDPNILQLIVRNEDFLQYLKWFIDDEEEWREYMSGALHASERE